MVMPSFLLVSGSWHFVSPVVTMRFSRNICGTPAQSLLLLTIVHDSFAQDGKVNNTGRAVSTAAGANTNSSLPTVDLGYSLYRPTAVNVSRNIQYMVLV